jgi:hypothetical protein
MRVQFVIALLALVYFSAVGSESLPDHCAILPTSEGSSLIKQCSRGSPTNVSDFWSPSPLQVNTIEKLLPKLLLNSGHKIKLLNSYHQYIGITSHGKKLIYLNSFTKSVVTESSEHLDWHKKAVIICDGGDAFWGAEFDPAENAFHNLQFNGIG